MFQYRQVLVRLRQDDSDRDIARAKLMGRRKVAALPDDAALSAPMGASRPQHGLHRRPVPRAGRALGGRRGRLFAPLSMVCPSCVDQGGPRASYQPRQAVQCGVPFMPARVANTTIHLSCRCSCVFLPRSLDYAWLVCSMLAIAVQRIIIRPLKVLHSARSLTMNSGGIMQGGRSIWGNLKVGITVSPS